MKLLSLIAPLLLIAPVFAQVEVDKRLDLTGTGPDARITGIEEIIAPGDAVNAASIQGNRLAYSASTGTSGNYSISLNPAPVAYEEGMVIYFKANHTSGGLASVNVNGLGAKPLHETPSLQLTCGQIEEDAIIAAVYDGTRFQVFTRVAPAAGSTVWQFRKPITVTNGGSALSNYQLLITFDHASLVSGGKSNADGSDLRFADQTGLTFISHWIESGLNTASCKAWVKIPSISPGSQVIYLYYEPSPKPDVSDGPNTFLFFDDFNDVSNGSRPAHPGWPSGGPSTVQDGKLRIQGAEPLTVPVGTDHIIEGSAQMTAGSNNHDFRIDVMRTAQESCIAANNYIQLLLPWEGGDSRADRMNTSCSAFSNIVNGGPKFTNYNFRVTTYVSGGLTYMHVLNTDNSTVLINTSTNHKTSGDYIQIGAPYNAGTRFVLLDNFRIRKYAAVVPSISIGGEQTVNQCF